MNKLLIFFILLLIVMGCIYFYEDLFKKLSETEKEIINTKNIDNLVLDCSESFLSDLITESPIINANDKNYVNRIYYLFEKDLYRTVTISAHSPLNSLSEKEYLNLNKTKKLNSNKESYTTDQKHIYFSDMPKSRINKSFEWEYNFETGWKNVFLCKKVDNLNKSIEIFEENVRIRNYCLYINKDKNSCPQL